MLTHNQITYIGHATLLLEMDGVRLLTDPLLRDRVFHLRRRSGPVRTDQYQHIDAVLISHLHWDHFDVSSLQMIGRDILLLVPTGAADLLHKNGFENFKELNPGDTSRVGALTILVTHAEHDGHYPPLRRSTDCLGFLIQASQKVYFPGDTDIFPGMADLASGLDVALMPVWGWGPNLGPGHMNPQRAAEALKLLRPRIAIPIHWGTFYPALLGWLRRQLMIEPPLMFKQLAYKMMPDIDVKILPPGSTHEIS